MHVNFIHKDSKRESALSISKVITGKKITAEDIRLIKDYFIIVFQFFFKDKESNDIFQSVLILKDKNIKLICSYFGMGSLCLIVKYNGKTSEFIYLSDVAKVVTGITNEKAVTLTKKLMVNKYFIKDNFLMDKIREFI